MNGILGAAPKKGAIVNRVTAEEVDKIMREVCGRLNDSIKVVMATSEAEEFSRYRRQIGKLMGEIFLEIQEPLYTQYPELTPPELRVDQKK